MSSIIWLTDRSRYSAGLDHCQRDRFLNFHFGEFGYGIAKKAQSIPLSSGITYHDGLAMVLAHVAATDQLPPDAVIRQACAVAVGKYQALIQLRGLQHLTAEERVDEIMLEQSTLIEGLIWAFCLTTLPWIHAQCRILSVEQEEFYLIGCTCGLGDGVGTLPEHEARDCEGIGWQSKPDFITEYRARPGVLAYWEFKGASYPGDAKQWATRVQFAAGALGAQARLEQPIAEAWVIELLKGRRQGADYDYLLKKASGPLIQNTTLCYWYRREGNPPLEAPDWQEQYEWKDEEGKGHRLGKNYQKRGLWRVGEDIPEIAQSGISVVEFCAKYIPRERLGRHVAVLGPLDINQVLLSELTEEIAAEEARWKSVVWELYEVLEGDAGGDWTDPAYQAALRRLVPRNFDGCQRYGYRYGCAYIPICFAHEGWGDPVGSGQYVPRRPHHLPELQQLEVRGLLPEAGWEDEPEEEG